MWARLRLGPRFNILLALVLVVTVLGGGLALWQGLQQRAEAEVTFRGSILIETMTSVRSYTSGHVRPLLLEELASEPEFVPESVPAFSARQVFEGFRKNERYASFFYKEATLNPTNPQDLADDFERGLVERMRQAANPGQESGFRTDRGESIFFIARPLSVSSTDCLACHGDPATAPASLLASYPQGGGFGWQLGEVVAAQIVYVPAQEVFDTAQRSFSILLVIFTGVFIFAVVMINLLLNRYVVKPVAVLASLAQEVSGERLEAHHFDNPALEQVAARSDELGNLARVFRKMVADLYAHTQSLTSQIRELHIEIDAAKNQQQVNEVVDSDFFRDLQSKARKLRERPK